MSNLTPAGPHTDGAWDIIFVILDTGQPTFDEWLAWHHACWIRQYNQSGEMTNDRGRAGAAGRAGAEGQDVLLTNQ